MNNIRERIYEKIDKNRPVRECLRKNLINKRALAEQIQRNLSRRISLNRVVDAINEYPSEREKRVSAAEELVKKSKIGTKNKMAIVRLDNTSKTHEFLEKILSSINFNKGESIRVVMGLHSVEITLDQENLDKILKLIPNEVVMDIKKNLSEITLNLPKEARETPGVAHRVTRELALNDINIMEIMTSLPDLILVIDEKNAGKAYNQMKELL